MQNLDVISLNLWQILISLCNLLILFLILKRFLYVPVKRVLKERDDELRDKYENARKTQEAADKKHSLWEQKLQTAEKTGADIITRASERAESISDEIVSRAKENANIIIKDAKKDADTAYKKAQDEIKNEIVDISAELTKIILNREITEKEHHDIINRIISEIGDNND